MRSHRPVTIAFLVALLFVLVGGAIGAVGIGGTAGAGKGSGADKEILALEERRIRAMLDADVATLDGILADDLSYVHSTGRTESKSEFLAHFESGDLQYRRVDRQDVRVRMEGCAAVVTGRAAMEVRAHGKDLAFPIQFTDVYVEKDGRWRMLAWQSTKIEPVTP